MCVLQDGELSRIATGLGWWGPGREGESHRLYGPEQGTCSGLGAAVPSPTSSCIPHSRSIVTQASMGKAISRPLMVRCSSRGFPKEGFSTQASERGSERGAHQLVMGTCA